MKKDCWST